MSINSPSGLLLQAFAHRPERSRLKSRYGLHAHQAAGTSFFSGADHSKVANQCAAVRRDNSG
ncbi:hypothetical protein CPI84_10490 [Erwinia pyrifoliae]|nr:hypothetical protein CPI84_10490 [Erwinia pyrifoliae]MCA8876862.1 hypothetical protein [Erwinia pyrifoliae]